MWTCTGTHKHVGSGLAFPLHHHLSAWAARNNRIAHRIGYSINIRLGTNEDGERPNSDSEEKNSREEIFFISYTHILTPNTITL
jgi:hypothetical protein